MVRINFNYSSIFLHDISFFNSAHLSSFLLIRRNMASSSYFNISWTLVLTISLIRWVLILVLILLSCLISSYRITSIIRTSSNGITSSNYSRLTFSDIRFMGSWLDVSFCNRITLSNMLLDLIGLCCIISWISSWFVSSNFNLSTLFICFIRYYIR